MKLTEPKQVTFIISVVLAILALLGMLVSIPFVSANAFWVLLVAFVVLALGVLLKDF